MLFDIPLDHAKCSVSSGLGDEPTLGQGRLGDNGYWQFGCEMCARAFEAKYPEMGPCWPFTDEVLERLRLNLSLRGDTDDAEVLRSPS